MKTTNNHAAKVIAVMNQKGGVGKTTTVVNLGIGLARREKKVLLIDADSQGSLSVCLGEHDLNRLDYTLASLMYGVIMNRPLDPHAAILHSKENVDYIPSNFELSGVDTALTGLANREFILKTVIDTLRGEYDYILIDCLPSLGLLAINTLVAADSVIISSSILGRRAYLLQHNPAAGKADLGLSYGRQTVSERDHCCSVTDLDLCIQLCQ